MSTRVYTLPVEQTRWHVEGGAQTVFTWEYDEGRDRLLNLYEKGKTKQWNSRDRIDWSTPVDHDNPFETLDAYVPIYGSDVWEEMGAARPRPAQAPPRRLAVLAVPARRAGRADLRVEDRPDRARHRQQVLRGHAGDGRGAPRRDVLALPAREARPRLPHQPAPQVAARQRRQRLALGHDLPRHAGAHRGPGAGRLRADPRRRREPAGPRGHRLRDGGRGAPRGLRPAGAARLLPAADRARARRARGVLRRGLLPDARPLPRRGGVGQPRACRSTSACASSTRPRRRCSSAACSSPASSPPSRTSGCSGRGCAPRSPTWGCWATATSTSTR